MSNGDRWMPLYVSDYLGDTMHLTTLQHGAYMLLLMHYWKAGPLPNDAEALASITRVDAKTWPAVWSKLAGFFTPNGDGTLHQKRMDSERERWADISSKRRDAGKRGAEAKHRTHPTNGGGPPTPLPQPNHEQPAVVPKHVIPQPSDAPRLSKTMANATSLPVDNLAIARDLPASLPEICQPISGNCHDFATPPVPSTEESKSLSLKPSSFPVLARIAAACETPQPGSYGAEPEQEPVTAGRQLATRNIVEKLARKMESSGKTPAGKRAQLTAVEQADYVLHGEVMLDEPLHRGPVDPERTLEEQYAQLLGIPLAEARARLGHAVHADA